MGKIQIDFYRRTIIPMCSTAFLNMFNEFSKDFFFFGIQIYQTICTTDMFQSGSILFMNRGKK